MKATQFDEIEARIDDIRRFLDGGQDTIAAKECVGILELAFRHLIQMSLGILDTPTRQKVFTVEQEIGRGNRGFDEFTFGELDHLLRSSGFFTSWSRSTGKQLQGIQILDMSKIAKLRNNLVHQGGTASHTEAVLLFHCVQSVLETFEILSLGAVSGTFEESPNVARQLTALDEIPPSEGEATASRYDPSPPQEQQRLMLQGDRIAPFDAELFFASLQSMPSDGHLVGLDIGAATGSVTTSRFDAERFEYVFGIDRNAESISVAMEQHGKPPFVFSVLDIESAEADLYLRDLLGKNGQTGFDVIFVALTLHHLANPVRVLRTLRYLLNPGGVVIVRSADDGLKVAYPDHERRLNRIIESTLRHPGVSDRIHGRKVYHQLYRAGFRDITVHVRPTTTVKLTPVERNRLFQESFAFRLNYLNKALEDSPQDRSLLFERDALTMVLAEFELDFEADDFFYMEFDIAGVARGAAAP